jgi:hypothetical protein
VVATPNENEFSMGEMFIKIRITAEFNDKVLKGEITVEEIG